MNGQTEQAKSIFLNALDIAAPNDRNAYLDSQCGTDEVLRREVEELLRHQAQVGGFLESPAMDMATVAAPIRERAGMVIGPYKLLQQIGEGGMGIVFMAEQTHPVQRKVALKVVKPGMDSRQVIARFEAERQALALMDHVNIARVLDAGTTAAESRAEGRDPSAEIAASGLDPAPGRPYFVMELVNGVPITKYCDDHHLTPRERLELFVPVCHAIQHAHQKGIIHRDIKPSNVMVTLYDGKPVPKVIDFGVAKATEQKLTERTLFTQYGTMVGTLEYMSPEQAEMSALGVDTRSDIYSLGVLLYELLTGSTPLSRERVRKAAYGEVLRMIKEEEPPKPSTRLSGSGDALTSISAQRKTESAKLSKLMRGELDWIVMKCLEKDRDRRYETANRFAEDVQRYLNDDPVQACPPSAMYRFRKFARRNKAALALAMTMALGVFVAVGTIGWIVRDHSARRIKLSYGVEIAMKEANLARERALARTANPFDWDAVLAMALSALKAAEELAAQDRAALDPAVAERLQRLRATLDADERDHRFVVRLDEILRGVIVWDSRRSQSKDEDSYLKLKDILQTYFEWDVGTTPITEVATFIQQRPLPIQEHLLAAFDVCLVRVPRDQPREQRWLANVLEVADPDPWRKQARDAVAAGDWPVLENLLKEVDVSQHRPAILYLFSSYLPAPAKATKTELYRQIRATHPGERWAHGQFTIALSYHVLAWQLMNPTDLTFRDETWAIELAQAAVRLAPNDGDFWNVLGLAYYRVGNWKESVAALEKAMELSKGGDSNDWLFLAMAHWQLGHKHVARQWYDQAVAWMDKNQPENAELRHFRAEAAELLGVNEL